MDNQATLRPTLGFSSMGPEVAPTVTPNWEIYQAKKAREAAATTGDYVGSMWRQDGITDGLIAHHVGQQMAPDPNYTPFHKEVWKDLTEGVWPEFQNQFGQANSAAHALYLKGRILQKQEDMIRLGDMGVAGNVARFALGALQPENLISGAAGAVVSRGLKGIQMARAVAGAEAGSVAEATAVAGVRAAQAKAASGASAVVSGMATSGATNAVLEKMRQSVNFEDDDTAVLEALLIGSLFPLPFEVAGARAQTRLAAAASREHNTMKVIEKFSKGEELTVKEAKLVDDVTKSHQIVADVEAGRMTPQQARELLDGFMGPELPDSVWLQRYGDDLKARGEAMLDEMFPHRVTDRTRQIFNPDGQPLQLGYEPTAGRSVGAPMQVTAGGVALPPGISKVEAEALIKAEAAKMFPKDPEAADRWAMNQRAALLGYKSEVATNVADLKEQRKNKTSALDKVRESRAAAMAQAKLASDPAIGPKQSPMEVIAGQKDPVEAPKGAQDAPKEAPPADPTVPPIQQYLEAPATPVKPAASKAGDSVSWAHAKTGDQMWGDVERVRDDGFIEVRDEDGKLHVVHQKRIDGYEDTPEGFVAGGSAGAAQASPIKDVAQQESRLSKARLDIFAILNRSESEQARSLVFQLVKDPLQVDKMEAQGWTASEVKSHIKRTVGGAFHREVRAAAQDAAKAMGVTLWQKPAFYHEFHSLTSRMTRGDFTVGQLNPIIKPMLERASKAQQSLYDNLLKQLKASGVKGADEIDPSDFYVNRVWHQRNIREAMEKHGRSNVLQLLANAINVPGFNGDVVKAGQFLDAVQKLEFSQTMQTMHLGAKDMGTLRNELSRHLQPHEIDLIVDTMFTAKEVAGSDAGRMGNLKYRFDIGENLSMTTPAGELRIADLFENDSRVLADTYLNSVGGRIGLAKQGIYSDADFQKLIKDITEESVSKGLKGVPDNVRLLEDVYANIVGRPMSTQDFSNTARFAAALRGYTRSVSLGQLGITAAFEMKQAIGLMGFRTFFTQLPAFRGMIQAMRNGYFPDDMLARDLEHMTGFGNEMSMSYARAQEIDDGFLGQQLNKFEDWSNKASHATDIMSGNASFTSLTRQLSSKMAAQRLSDFAYGRKELTPKMRERLVGWGMSDDQIDTVFGQFKKYSTVDPKSGKLEGIDWEKWAEEAPGTYETFQLTNSRMVRDAIQDQDIGETMPFMHTSLGKVFAELKTFFLVAHAKNMLKNLSYADATAFHVWSIAFIGEALLYSMQTSINYAGNQEKLDKMLDPGTIALAAMARSPVSGMLPFFANTAYQIGTGGDSLIGPDMTSSGNGRSFVPASVGTVQRLWAAPSSAMGLVLDNGNVTKSEGLDLWRTLPMSNMLGMRNLGNYLTNSLPASEAPQQ